MARESNAIQFKNQISPLSLTEERFGTRLKKDLIKYRGLYLLIIPVVIYYVVFHYVPMYGLIISFKDFSPATGILGSRWVGLKHFKSFLSSPYFGRVFKNTINISFWSLAAGFPAPILLALLINEVQGIRYKKLVQTVSYIPHFISLVVVVGMIKTFTGDGGFLNTILTAMHITTGEDMLNVKEYFVPIYVISGVWQGVGWGTIIYLAALSSISQDLYEATEIAGAGRWQQTIRITLPSLMPTIVMLLILQIGSLMNVGYEKIILMYNPLTYETADVISSFVYRKGLLEAGYSYSSAVGLFNSVINFFLLITANYISKKCGESAIW